MQSIQLLCDLAIGCKLLAVPSVWTLWIPRSLKDRTRSTPFIRPINISVHDIISSTCTSKVNLSVRFWIKKVGEKIPGIVPHNAVICPRFGGRYRIGPAWKLEGMMTFSKDVLLLDLVLKITMILYGYCACSATQFSLVLNNFAYVIWTQKKLKLYINSK